MRYLIIIFFIFLTGLLPAQILPGFRPSGSFAEQQMVIEDSPPGTRILINAPLSGFGEGDRVLLILYALPNGNTIEQTFGKRLREDDDWHYDIQHISAQTRFLRQVISDRTVVVAYLENNRKSWPNGKPLVSPTGGTWYRSKMMKNYIARSFRLKERQRDSLLWVSSRDRRIEFIFKPNPEGKIYHTRQVEYNGFIHSMLSGTKYEQKGYRYFGSRAYSDLIADTVIIPIRAFNIPARDPLAETGTAFMSRIRDLPREEREEEIFRAAASGNIPGFLRETVTLRGVFNDLKGNPHTLEYEVMPDYLAIGSDNDFCRIPMNPRTAQRLADLFGASMLTATLSDHIWSQAAVRLEPFFYKPVGNANELVAKFEEHNAQIEKQLAEAGGRHGQLVAGIKKDVIISSRIAERPDRVVIYGWHKPDGNPIQPVYSGHVYWYVDYSHGIRFMNRQVLLDGRPADVRELMKDPVLFRVLSNEAEQMSVTNY